MQVQINLKGDAELTKALKTLGKVGVKQAIRGTLNSAAFQTRAEIQKQVKSDFVLRNTFTERSIQVDKVKTSTVSRMESTVGSIAHYMDEVEEGGIRTNRAGQLSKWVTSGFASGEEGAAVRRKVPKRQHLLKNIKLNRASIALDGSNATMTLPTRRTKKNPTGGSRSRVLSGIANRGHANRMLIEEVARRTDSKYIYLETARRKGIYKVIKDGAVVRVKLMYDLSKDQIKIKPHPIIEPNARQVGARLPQIYQNEIKRLLR